MAESNELQRFKYAVCPRIDRSGSTGSPKFFKTESAAWRFLNSEAAPRKLEAEAKAAGLSLTEFKAQRRGVLTAAAKKVKSGELHAFAYPILQEPILNKHQGWEAPVPVCHLTDFNGSKCKKTLRDCLPAEGLGPLPESTSEEEFEDVYVRAIEGRSGKYSCCLDEDWRFDEMEADAWRRPGHEFDAARYHSIGETVVRAIHDLEATFQKLHPNAPCAAAAAFWRSWQVQRHIADVCSRLVKSGVARCLVSKMTAGDREAERWRVHLYRQLAAFAHGLSDERDEDGAGGREEAAAEVASNESDAGPTSAVSGLDDMRQQRSASVNRFLLECSQKLTLKITRKHIWQAVGHKTARQFQYWQASDLKATAQDHPNFSRILAMSPAEFEALLKQKKII